MKKITENWWNVCLKDKEKLEHWLVSLYNNEKDAEDRFLEFANNYCDEGTEEYNTFVKIASEERNHAILVDDVLSKLNIEKYIKSTKDGRYWRNTIPCIYDKKTAAAIGAFAEGLSLKRMRVIIANPLTPQILIDMFSIIEPEEAVHAKMLEKIATKYGMKEVKDCHDKGLQELGLKISSKSN